MQGTSRYQIGHPYPVLLCLDPHSSIDHSKSATRVPQICFLILLYTPLACISICLYCFDHVDTAGILVTIES